jgi:hypothetical protein
VKRYSIHEENNKKSRCIPLLLLWAFMAYTKVNIIWKRDKKTSWKKNILREWYLRLIWWHWNWFEWNRLWCQVVWTQISIFWFLELLVDSITSRNLCNTLLTLDCITLFIKPTFMHYILYIQSYTNCHWCFLSSTDTIFREFSLTVASSEHVNGNFICDTRMTKSTYYPSVLWS